MTTPFADFKRFRITLLGTGWGKSAKARRLGYLVENNLLKLEPRIPRIISRDELRQLMLEAGLLDTDQTFEAIIQNDLHDCDQALVEGLTAANEGETLSLWKLRETKEWPVPIPAPSRPHAKKEKAKALWLTGNMSLASIAKHKDVGVNPKTLSRWQKEWLAEG